MKKMRLAVGGVGLAVVVSVALARGSLNPPAGPVQPTGRTLTEIYERVGSAGGGGGAPASWSHETLAFGTDGAFVTIVSGAGLLHGVRMSAPTTDGSAVLTIRVDGAEVHRLRAAPFSSLDLNVRFSQSVEVRRQGGGSDVVALYALD